MKTEAEELAERLEHAAEFTEADFDVCSAEDLRQAASLLRRQAEGLKEAEAEQYDPTEGLPGKLTDIARWAASGHLISGGDIEQVEEAARRLSQAEAQLERVKGALPVERQIEVTQTVMQLRRAALRKTWESDGPHGDFERPHPDAKLLEQAASLLLALFADLSTPEAEDAV